MSAAWLAASIMAVWASGDVLAPRSLLSISLLLVALSVLWLSVSAAAVVGLAAGVFSVVMGSAALEQAMFLVLMAGICAYFSRPPVRWVFLAAAGVWSAWYASHLHEVSAQIFVFGSMIVLLLGAYALGTGARRLREKQEQDRRELEAAERRHRESLAAERRSLARDLHDVVAHDITVIAMQAEMARLGQDDALIRRTMRRVGESSRATLEDLGRIVTVLSGDDTGHEGGSERGHRLTVVDGLEKFRLELESLGIRTRTLLSGSWEGVSPAVERSVYRILQECCTNVIKYGARGADAACTLSAEMTAEGIELCVTNSLPAQQRDERDIPFSSEEGLRNIRKRASEFGGRVEAGVTSPGTWKTRVSNLGRT
ncbi:sensor histidine kinase [Nesterenkonia cremea]|uniref:histidine kinase n=1 Tax=Nesterenkonia cremea TaxID=1882340 RepID=A0A917EQ50_9MICC|nr:histidine kinase [Nesterenkonia cremea]GGE71570.1 hypothetical protein GCM10011401_18300 [Nesterenkonia cremea]